MSKERARRRAEREAQAAVVRAKRARSVARRERRRALLRKFTPRPAGRRTGRLFARRTKEQRAVIAVLVLVIGVIVWWQVDSLALRLALLAILALGLPAFIILALDRRT